MFAHIWDSFERKIFWKKPNLATLHDTLGRVDIIRIQKICKQK